MTRAEVPLTRLLNSPWLRVTVIDAAGKRAWSNPFWRESKAAIRASEPKSSAKVRRFRLPSPKDRPRGVSPKVSAVVQNSRQAQLHRAGMVQRDVIARIGMAHHAGRRVVPQHVVQPRAASSVPSATITMPECCEKPMPTPPP
jgi:hypothetical protein